MFFRAIINKVGLKPWASAIAHKKRKEPKTSRERYLVKYLRKVEMLFILSYFFQAKMAKLEKFQLHFSSLELEFLLLAR